MMAAVDWLVRAGEVVFACLAGAFLGYVAFLMVLAAGSLILWCVARSLEWVDDGGLMRLALRVAFGVGAAAGACVLAWRALVRWCWPAGEVSALHVLLWLALAAALAALLVPLAVLLVAVWPPAL